MLFWVALRLPYLLGTLCHHEEAGLPEGEQQHRAAAYLLPDPTGVASALTESRRRLYPSRCGYLLGAAGKSLPQTKERAALRLPYPLGTPATMRRQALADEAAAPGRLYPLGISIHKVI